MNIYGSVVFGVSIGDVMVVMEKLVVDLLEGFGFQWIGLFYQEQQVGNQVLVLYVLLLLVVFLSLVVLYESWLILFVVMLIVFLGIIGVVLVVLLWGFENDVFFQVGLLIIIGLLVKNVILIVEFVKDLEDQGCVLFDVILEVICMWLCLILMMLLVFGFGVMLLMLSSGVGFGVCNVIGIGVFGGIIVVMVLVIFFILLFYVVVCKLFGVLLIGKKEV